MAVSACILIEWLFIISGRMWLPILHESIAWTPFLVAVAMSMISVFILKLFNSMTATALALLAGTIAMIALLNAGIMNALSSV